VTPSGVPGDRDAGPGDEDLLQQFQELVSRVGTEVAEESLVPVLNELVAKWQVVARAHEERITALASNLERVSTYVSQQMVRCAGDAEKSVVRSVSEAQRVWQRLTQETDIPAQMRELSKHARELWEVASRLQSVTGELSSATRRLATQAEEALSRVEKRLPSLISEIRALNDGLAQMRAQHAETTSVLTSLQKLGEAFQRDASDMVDAARNLDAKLTDYQSSTASHLSALGKAVQSVNELQARSVRDLQSAIAVQASGIADRLDQRLAVQKLDVDERLGEIRSIVATQWSDIRALRSLVTTLLILVLGGAGYLIWLVVSR